jgi:hypothetical protein
MRDIEAIELDLEDAKEEVILEDKEIEFHRINRDSAQKDVYKYAKELKLAELARR